jgi:hypothetical protein
MVWRTLHARERGHETLLVSHKLYDLKIADVDEFHFSGYGTKAVVKELDQNQY